MVVLTNLVGEEKEENKWGRRKTDEKEKKRSEVGLELTLGLGGVG